MPRSKAWFAAKRYGYGSSLPIAWQGWVLFVAFIVLFVAAAGGLQGVLRWMVMAGLLVGFFVIAALKTEGGWRWRWPRR